MRAFLLAIGLGFGVFAGMAWYLDLLPEGATGSPHTTEPQDGEVKGARELGAELYESAPLLAPVADPAGPGQLKDPIVIEGHNVVLEKQEVPGKRAGQLLFIGEDVPEGAPLPAGLVYTAKIFQGGNVVVKRYRPLEEGARVTEDQMVAMLDCSLAFNDWMSKKAKIDAGRADYNAAIRTKLEAQDRLNRLDRILINTRPGFFVSAEEYGGARLTRDRYAAEEQAKKAALTQMEIDADQAQIILREHEIRNKIPGVSILKTIYKHRGEAVKEQEAILQLYNIDWLRAEGLIEVQYLDQLREGMKVSLEPVEEQPPLRVLNEHRGAVTSVAVSGAARDLLIVSGSLDGTARVWSPAQGRALRVLHHGAAVRAVACSPEGARRRWLLTGCADGALRLWVLDKGSERPDWDSRMGETANPHRDAISALAFSPDGAWFATGGEDNTIALWQSADCKLLYTFDAEHGVGSPHQGAITALHFTPQCQLVSASRDNTLRVWGLRRQGAHLIGEQFAGRGGSVGNLGVSKDGQWALLDKGKMLQVLSLADRRIQGIVQNVSSATPFEALALFSPDARLLLTAGAPEGRLQLWRAPTDGKRGFELRQFATGERSPVTCAAFAPDGALAVSGTKDGYVYLWSVPDRDKISRHRMENLKLTLIERSLDASTRQARIGVNVQNPINSEYPLGRLIPGRPVHIVIEPE